MPLTPRRVRCRAARGALQPSAREALRAEHAEARTRSPCAEHSCSGDGRKKCAVCAPVRRGAWILDPMSCGPTCKPITVMELLPIAFCIFFASLGESMGGSSSKAGSAAARAVRTMPKSGAAGKSAHPAASQLGGDDDLLSKFKPTKVVEMSRPEAQAAAKSMYDQQVPDMNPDILRKAMELGPVSKAELVHQKMVPDKSELVMNKSPRPLPKDRTRAVVKSSEVDAKKGLLTQTQLQALLGRVGESSSQQELTKSLVEEFHLTEYHAALLLRYYRVPDIRLAGDVMTARWRWPTEDRSAIK